MTLPVQMNRGTENDSIVFHRGHVTYCDVTPPGESGFIGQSGRSPHYDDQLSLYQNFGCKQEWLDGAEVKRHAASTETLAY